MTNENSSTGVTTRCQFQFTDGRRCRMSRHPDHSSLCPFHAREELQARESQRLGAEISVSLNGDFLTATDINHVLRKLFIAVAQNRIPPRNAAVLTYLGQVLLTSLANVKKEFPFDYKFDHWNSVLTKAAPLSGPPSLTISESSPGSVAQPPEPDSPSSTGTLACAPLK